MNTNTVDPTRSVPTLANISGILKRQDNADKDERILLLEQQLETLRGELHQGRDLAHPSVATQRRPPIFSSLESPIPKQYQSAQPPLTTIGLTNPSSPFTPINSHRFPYFTPHPNVVTSSRDIQQINYATFRELYMSPICVTETPTFTIPAKSRFLMNSRTKEQNDIIVNKLRHLKQAMTDLQETQVNEHLDYEDLCIHPDVDLPVGFKPPKFCLFNEIGDPHTYLRAYSNKFFGIGNNEKLIMKLFIRSLSGEALAWYTKQDPCHWLKWSNMAKDFMNRFKFNTEIAPDRLSLISIQKKPSESFQEYAR
ncbi:uncharacterized protein LOC107868603 [Capsicum annuum]|uniref:uncharacterized protein LOC107868603 n=1 Tax=Capsicum annuum TaxID=4072 RepID=UPI0007BFA523|nr:uncharacterized protein LOC107868603 [Capsicum annuum]